MTPVVLTRRGSWLALWLLGACSEPIVSIGQDSPFDAGDELVDAQLSIRDTALPVEENEDLEDEHECNEHEPVCGSDQRTYYNRCYAADAGVGIAHGGSCK